METKAIGTASGRSVTTTAQFINFGGGHENGGAVGGGGVGVSDFRSNTSCSTDVSEMGQD
jgi:hypothetical protein